jgi:hypothetical protein
MDNQSQRLSSKANGFQISLNADGWKLRATLSRERGQGMLGHFPSGNADGQRMEPEDISDSEEEPDVAKELADE